MTSSKMADEILSNLSGPVGRCNKISVVLLHDGYISPFLRPLCAGGEVGQISPLRHMKLD